MSKRKERPAFPYLWAWDTSWGNSELLIEHHQRLAVEQHAPEDAAYLQSKGVWVTFGEITDQHRRDLMLSILDKAAT